MRFEPKKIQLIEVPQQMWFTIPECCELKGLNSKTAYNKQYLLPDAKYEAIIGGRKAFRRDGVIEWLMLTDNDLNCLPDENGKIESC